MGIRSFLVRIGIIREEVTTLTSRRDALVKDLDVINDAGAFSPERRKELLECMERYMTGQELAVFKILMARVDKEVQDAQALRKERGTRTSYDKKALASLENDNLSVVMVMASKVKRKIETDINDAQRAIETAS